MSGATSVLQGHLLTSSTLLQSVVLVLVVSACGSHDNAEIPPALLAAIADRNTSATHYPAGPYGADEGDIAQDVCVRGWSDPAGQSFAEAKLEPLCFSDFYDPDAKNNSLLLVNTSALWCTACRTEYGGTASRPALGSEAAKRRAQGLRVLGVLFQDAERNPATFDHAALWANTFAVDFPFGFDAPFAMGAFADPILQPFNMLLDTRDMRILLTLQGDDPQTLWPAIDAQLVPEQ